MEYFADYKYIEFDGELFFTVILLPDSRWTFPTIIKRSPYVAQFTEKTEDEIVQSCLTTNQATLDRGYAVVYQHCRGQGKSTGAFVPYIQEHEDSRFLREWIRKQPFYNGELYLQGASYTSSLHYEATPFEEDIKGAVFEVQDSERYRLWYRNGQMRKGHANWHFNLYKDKCNLTKTHTMKSFSRLPLKNLSKVVLGECAQDFEEMLAAERPEHDFWNTRAGGVCTRNALKNVNIPILLTTGYNDFYVGGVFDMWDKMDKETKAKSALLVSPYDHGDGCRSEKGILFPNGKRREAFGEQYPLDWFDHIRKGTEIPFSKGEITYYRAFENKWETGFKKPQTKDYKISLGCGEETFCYNPLDPPAFCEPGIFIEGTHEREDVITVYTKPLDRDVFIKGKMKAVLQVASDCEDTSFYVHVSIKKSQGEYSLRHDITSLCYQLEKYDVNDKAELTFHFDEYAFLLRKNECLRIDISSTDDNTYVCHTNQKGPYYLQTSVKTATNKVFLDHSFLILPIEE